MNSKQQEMHFRVWQMRQQGLSQQVIAEQLQVSQSTVSTVCKGLDDAEILWQMVQAEEPPVVKSGDPNIDSMEAQARTLQRAQARCGSGTPEFSKRAELIGWLLLKSAQLRQALPNSGKDRTEYHYKAVSGIRPTPRITQMDPSTIDRALLADFELAHRVARLDCPKCGEQVWAKIELDYTNTGPLPESALEYSETEAKDY
jgi:transcriptional regulator with XRE-family HTH domain